MKGDGYAIHLCATLALMISGLLLSHPDGVESSCHRANMCCQGKNSTCRTQGRRANNPNSRPTTTTTCFCDTDCLLNGDCCDDHERACVVTRRVVTRVVDCVVAKVWDNWSDCSARCGYGTKHRKRGVLVKPLNGGRQCDNVIEVSPCEGNFCKVTRSLGQLEQIKEIGKIIPAKFGSFRINKLYNPYMDIRKNLFEHYEGNSIDKVSPYCAKYELTEIRPGCYKSAGGTWENQLVKGTTVCVECQSTAMKDRLGGRCRGQGMLQRDTRWSATTSTGCHGRWVMRSAQTECQCDPSSDLSFVLV